MQARCILCVLLASMVYSWLVKADDLATCSLKNKSTQCTKQEQAKKAELLIKSSGIQSKAKVEKNSTAEANSKNEVIKKPISKEDLFYAKKLDQAYSQIKTMQANFKQSYSTGIKEKHAHGVVYISRPGKMKWEYANPKGKFFLADGKHIRLFDPEFNQVAQSEQSHVPVGLALLFGEKKASDLFDIYVIEDKKSTVRIKLIVKDEAPNVDHIEMLLKKGTVYSILETKVFDVFGGENIMTFSQIQNNQRLKNSTFEFIKPKGAKIVSLDSVAF